MMTIYRDWEPQELEWIQKQADARYGGDVEKFTISDEYEEKQNGRKCETYLNGSLVFYVEIDTLANSRGENRLVWINKE